MSTTSKDFFVLPLLIITITFSTVFQKTCAQVGVVYSPFVGQSDYPGVDSYTKDDVKVMLNIVKDQGYHEVTTYGVGSRLNQSPASIVHTAAAAAEINNDTRTLALAVYQGLYLNTGELNEINTEIELGMNTAESANNIFSGTVKGIVFPADSQVDKLFNYLNQMKMVSEKARSLGIKYGTRITDCAVIASRTTNENFKKMIQLLDFIICQILPNESDIMAGFEIFFQLVEKKFLKAANETNNIPFESRSTPVQFILETGWPGVENMTQQKNVLNMLSFWKRVENWSKENRKQVFMHEAFDNPWKNDNGKYFGRWKHKGTNDNSKSAYELKVGVNPPVPSTGPSNELIFGVVFGLVLFLTLTAIMTVLYRRVYRLKFTKLTKEELRQFLDGIVTNEVVNEEGDQDNPWTRMAYNRDFELAKNKFSIDKTSLLGSGAFGSVFKGRIDGLVNDVAFKMTRPDCPVSALRGLLSEIKILIYLGKHENIVSICGAYTAELSNGIVYVATELCSNGSLEKYLRSKKSGYISLTEARYVTAPESITGQITDLQLLRWTLEIASAMEYISSKNIIHADLATRNVLLTAQFTVKVTDFGLSRRLYEYTEYVKKQQEPLPWRWMAVESLKQLNFSVKSDVWSFGITMWEIFSLGDIPYPGLNWDINFVTELENGLRVQQPPRATHLLYEIMESCWDLDPINRPAFPVLKDAILMLSLQLQKEQDLENKMYVNS